MPLTGARGGGRGRVPLAGARPGVPRPANRVPGPPAERRLHPCQCREPSAGAPHSLAIGWLWLITQISAVIFSCRGVAIGRSRRLPSRWSVCRTTEQGCQACFSSVCVRNERDWQSSEDAQHARFQHAVDAAVQGMACFMC